MKGVEYRKKKYGCMTYIYIFQCKLFVPYNFYEFLRGNKQMHIRKNMHIF